MLRPYFRVTDLPGHFALAVTLWLLLAWASR